MARRRTTESRRTSGVRESSGLPGDSQPRWATSGLVKARVGDESVCKPDSVPPRGGGDHPSAAGVAAGLRGCPRATYPGASREQRSNGVRGPKPFLVLLRVGFTEPPPSPRALVVSYTAVSPLPAGPRRTGALAGGLFSVALSRGLPRVGVTHHPALWSPDFPRLAPRSPDRLVRCLAYPSQGRLVVRLLARCSGGPTRLDNHPGGDGCPPRFRCGE